jgi:hypothetical protein
MMTDLKINPLCIMSDNATRVVTRGTLSEPVGSINSTPGSSSLANSQSDGVLLHQTTTVANLKHYWSNQSGIPQNTEQNEVGL